MQVGFARIANGLPLSGLELYLRCPDTGVECGGSGKVTLRVWAE